jgi:hypothetical protein
MRESYKEDLTGLLSQFFSAVATSRFVLTTLSGLSEIESMPVSIRNLAKSG